MLINSIYIFFILIILYIFYLLFLYYINYIIKYLSENNRINKKILYIKTKIYKNIIIKNKKLKNKNNFYIFFKNELKLININ